MSDRLVCVCSVVQLAMVLMGVGVFGVGFAEGKVDPAFLILAVATAINQLATTISTTPGERRLCARRGRDGMFTGFSPSRPAPDQDGQGGKA